jgi:hypothetical protein
MVGISKNSAFIEKKSKAALPQSVIVPPRKIAAQLIDSYLQNEAGPLESRSWIEACDQQGNQGGPRFCSKHYISVLRC